MEKLIIKEKPELRHVLSHIMLAIQALSNDNKEEALYELESIEGLVFFGTDLSQTAIAQEVYNAKEEK
jgi:hypothetical protein